MLKKLLKTQPIKKIKNDLIYVMILFFIRLLRTMKRQSAIKLVKGIGQAAFVLAKKERNKTLRHLTWAFGTQKTQTEIRALAKQVFSNISTCVADALRLPVLVSQGLDKIVSVEGMEHLTHAIKQGRGVILQTGHYGNWELLGTWVAQKKIPIKVIAKPSYDPRLDKLLVDYRNQAGYANTARGKATKVIVSGLKKGQVFGMLFDIDTKVKGDFVTFFDRPAHTATIPAILSMQIGSPIVPVFIRLCRDLTYRITFLPPINLVQTGNEAKDILANTQQCSDIYETWIRKHPEQWIWMHERWKKKPGNRPPG